MNVKVLVIEDDVKTWKDAILKTSQRLYEQGYVEEDFAKNCILREQQFPTGLNTEVPIAIPHTESEFVKETAICFLRLKKPVAFMNMEDASKSVYAHYVLNLAIKESKKQVSMLAKVIQTFQDGKFLNTLETMDFCEFENVLKTKFSDE